MARAIAITGMIIVNYAVLVSKRESPLTGKAAVAFVIIVFQSLSLILLGTPAGDKLIWSLCLHLLQVVGKPL